MSDNGNDLGAFLAGFVIGGLVGAATALILAPQSGEATRDRIVDRSREMRRAGEERVQQYRSMADTYAHDYREKAGQVLSETRGRIEEAGGQVQEQARIVLDAGKGRVSHIKEQVDTLSRKGEDEKSDTPADEADASA